MFDYRDGVSWKNATNAMAGGPLGGQGDGVWNRDAVVAERIGFDCAKGHPAMGNYHHHQNPSAYNLDLAVVSNVCDLYLADGLYLIDSSKHSPLLGFAYDGFPIYGAYAYKNVDGTGGIVRIKSSYSLRNITTRTHYADGQDVTDGPTVNTTYPLGLFREDYEYNTTSVNTPDYLDEHNGRFCVTPEYPNGIYCYFSTVNETWNSAYPYIVGPTFYGVKNVVKVTSISEPVITYNPTSGLAINNSKLKLTIYPNPVADVIAIQIENTQQLNFKVELFDLTGKLIQQTDIFQGSTIGYLETTGLAQGEYIICVGNDKTSESRKVILR